MTVTPSDSRGYWETYPCQVVLMADREVYTFFYEGDYDALEIEAAECIVGNQIAIPSGTTDGRYQSVQIITGSQLSRKKGGLGILTVQFTALYKREIWNVDFAEVSKDIKTWLVSEYTGGKTIPQSIWEEYGKLSKWENQRTIEAWDSWSHFEYECGKFLTGKTLTLAQKIMKGVTNYVIYAPVISRTTIHAIAPTMGAIGKKQKPTDLSGWTGFNNQPLNPSWVGLAKEWLKTSEKSSSNMDGTFTLVEQWQGMDEVDPDLYPSA